MPSRRTHAVTDQADAKRKVASNDDAAGKKTKKKAAKKPAEGAPVKKGGKGGKEDKAAAEKAAEAEALALAAGDEDTSYDRFAAIRSNLALSLRRAQKELSKQSTCSRCATLLTRPARFVKCRHVLCEACVEQTVRYFRECPICFEPLTSNDFNKDPYCDPQHAKVSLEPLEPL